jgi:hypothetical protein
MISSMGRWMDVSVPHEGLRPLRTYFAIVATNGIRL